MVMNQSRAKVKARKAKIFLLSFEGLMQSRARVNASSFMQGKAKICCIKPPEGACDRPPRLSRPADKNNLSQKIKNRGFC
jgi:hypothetical protein